TPFTQSYARTKIRAWVLRESCRWIRAAIPENEPAGLLRFARSISSILNRKKGLIGSHALLPRYSMCQWRPSPSSTKDDNGSNLAKVRPVERILVTHHSVPTWFLSGNR